MLIQALTFAYVLQDFPSSIVFFFFERLPRTLQKHSEVSEIDKQDDRERESRYLQMQSHTAEAYWTEPFEMSRPPRRCGTMDASSASEPVTPSLSYLLTLCADPERNLSL